MKFQFCPLCARPLKAQTMPDDGAVRHRCSHDACSFVHWDNPVPVVAAIVEHEGHVILARNKAWPAPFYALITGFLEKTDASPQQAVLREVFEELGLQAHEATFIGHYQFARQNQIIMAYHVPASGVITLGDELADYKRIPPERLRYWPEGTGPALRDWALSRGFEPQPMELPAL